MATMGEIWRDFGHVNPIGSHVLMPAQYHPHLLKATTGAKWSNVLVLTLTLNYKASY